MGRAILVTATDTGAGKTFVAALLGAALGREGIAVRPLKPVESGCGPGEDGKPFPEDASILRDAIAPDLALSEVCLYALPDPVSPHLAAQAAGTTIDDARIRGAIARAADSCDVVLVEGAGGVTVEIREGYSFADLARDAALPVLVVAENRLGVLNHLRLTSHFLRSEGLPLAGVILNDRTPEQTPVRGRNEEEIGRIAGDRFLGRVPHGASVLPEGILSRFLRIFRRL